MKITSLIKSKIFSIFSHKILFCSLLLIFASFSLFGVEYKTISSSSPLSWFEESSWQDIDGNGEGDIPEINGNTEVKIELNANISAETLAFNSSGSNKIELLLNGNTLTVKNIYLESYIDHTDKNYGNLHIYGDGAVKITTFDTSNNSADVPHKMFLYDGAEIYVTTNLYPDQSKVEITDRSKNCKFYLTASGANVNYGESGIKYIDINPEPYGEPKIYKVIDMGGNPFSATGKEIKFYTEKDTSDTNIQPIKFQYSVKILGENQNWTLEDISLTTTTDFSNLPVVTIPRTEAEKTLDLKCLTSLESLAVGAGIVITIKTPDGTMDLAEIRWIKGEVQWTGAKDTVFSEPENWSQNETPLTDISALKNNTVVIPSGCENYPILEEKITVKKLSIKTNGSLTVSSNGELTTEKLELTGTGKILASDGTVKFTDFGNNPSYSSETPYLSNFGTIEVQSGTFNLNYPLTLTQLNIASGATFVTTADLLITKSLTNSGTFQAGKVSLEPSEDTVTITGQSGDFKISELYCINQAGKNLVINNAISVGKIALSGSSDNRLSIRGNGIIYLETECGDDENDIAQYLDLDENSLPKIENQYITVSDGQFSSENNDIFVENHWINGDAIEYKWVGGASGNENNWNERTNWNIRKVPGEDKKVIIPPCQNPPILTENPNKLLSLSVEEGASINFAGKDVTATTITNQGEIDFAGSKVNADSITNNGTVKLTGKETFKKQDDTKTSLNNGEASTVIYYGTNENAEFVWGGSYEKLVIEDGFSGSFTPSGIFQSSTSFSVANSIEVENGKVFTKKDVTKDVLALGGAVKIDNKSDSLTINSEGDQNYNFDIDFEKSVFLQSNGSINFPANSEKKFNNGLTLKTTNDFSNTGKLISENGDISITSASFENAQSSEISANKDFICNVTESFSNAGAITSAIGKVDINTKSFINKNYNLESPAKIKTENGLINVTTSNFENSGDISAYLDFTCAEPEIFTNAGTITSETGKIDVKAQIMENPGSLSAKSGKMTITATGDFTNAGTITAAGNLVVNQVENFTNSGNITAYEVEIVATGYFKNEGSFISENGEINITSANFENAQSSELSAKFGKMTIIATGDFTNKGAITAENGDISIKSVNFANAQSSGILAKTGKMTVSATGDFENTGTITAESGAISITAKTFTNSEGKTISAKTGFTCEITDTFTNEGIITSEGKLIVNPVINFTNEGTITAVGVEINATGIFTNEETIASLSGDVSIKSASFENAQSSELSANSGKMTIIATGDFTNEGIITAESGAISITAKTFSNAEGKTISAKTGFSCVLTDTFTNAGTITAVGVEINATGDFRNQGKIDSSTGLLKITAKSITTSGEIKANSGEFISTESDILFAENSETTFEAWLTITSAENFTNKGAITAESGAISITAKTFTNAEGKTISAKTGKMTVSATGDFTNAGAITAAGNLVINQVENFTNSSNITALGIEIVAIGNFTNSGNFISENGEIIITSASFENTQYSEFSANSGKITISATSDFTNAGTITAAGKLVINQVVNFTNTGNITASGVEIVATGDFTNSGTITASGTLVVNQVENFTNSSNITALGIEVDATGDFTNEGSFTSKNGEISITSASFENSQSCELSANSGKMTIIATSDFTNAGTITAKNGDISIKSANFTNAQSSEILAKTGKMTVSATGDFENTGTITAESGAISITAKTFTNAEGKTISAKTGFTCEITDTFTNAGTITAVGVEINATGDFRNQGKIDSSSGLLKITAKSITTFGEIKAQSGELTSKVGDVVFAENSASTFIAGLTVTSAENFKNAGVISAYEVEIEATGDFPNSGKIDSSTGLLKITAKAITTSGEIKANSGDFESTETDILFAENSENTFTAGLTVTSAGNFENYGTITASGNLVVNQVENFTNSCNITALGVEIGATGDFTNSGTITATGTLVVNQVENFTNSSNITASGIEIEATGNFKNEGNFISENGEINITSANFENAQSSEISAKSGKMTITATGDFTNAGNIDSSSGLLKITAKSFTTSGEINAQSGDFENSGTITALGVEIVATGNFTNSGRFISENGDITITSASFENTQSSEISANPENTFTGKLVVTTATDFANKGTITAYEVEIVATGDFKNEGSFISENGDIIITSANFENAQYSELSANSGKITISATSDFTNAGTITAVGKLVINQVVNFTNTGNITAPEVEIVATGNFTNSGKIDSSTGLLKITAKSITTSGEIKANSGEFISTESDILFAENSENTFEVGFTVTSAGNFENYGTITALGIEVDATGDFTNAGTITASGNLVVNQVINFTNTDNITALGLEIEATGDFTNSGKISSSGKLLVNSVINFTNTSNITAYGIEIVATGNFTNSGTIDSSSQLLKITAKSITTSGEIKAQSGELTSKVGDVVFAENSASTFIAGLTVTSAENFTNKGAITAESGAISITSANFENAQSSEISAKSGKMTITATGDFKNSGSFISENGEISITSASFENAQSSELSVKSGKMTISATGDFTNSGKIDSSTGLLKITAKSITTSGEIKAQSGELTSKVGDVVFAENSASTFIAGLTVTSAGNFENDGSITAYGIEIVATSDFTNAGNLISENGDISITSANFENASLSEIAANKDFVCNVTESFSNAGIITSASGKVDINTKSFINKNYNLETPAKIKTENGLINVTTSNFENSGDISAYLDFTCAEPEIFTNAGTITSETGKIDVKAQIMENPGSLFAINGKIDIFTELFETTKEIFGKNIDINSQSSIFAGLVKSGAGDIYISSDLLITHPVEFCLGGSLIIGTVENPKNLVISSLDKNQNATEVKFSQNDDLESIETKVIVSGYAIIFNGNVTLSTNIDIANDFVLLNGITSGENSIYRDSITEIDGLFAYNLFGRGDFDFIDFPSDLPFSIEDNKLTTKTLSHEKYNTHFSIAEGKIISVGKNFYCNGVDLGLNTSAEWFLKIPGNDVATSAFAECYNASIKNCKVVANTNPEDYAWLSTENAKDETGNTNVAFSKAVLSSTEVSTISDNIIFIKFIDELNGKEIKIENSCNEISAWLENFRFNVSGQISEDNPGIQFTGVYANPECIESTDGKGDLSTFYLKYEIPTDGSIDYRWNTDAIGNSYGSEESTDSSGNYKKVIPNIAFERALNASYAGLRDEHKNRLVSVGTDDIGSNPLFTETKDKASPVLIAVTLGQEQHETDASSQHHYDSHNFIDWQFSEPVEFENYPKNGISQIDSVDTSANSENIQATATFGKITNQGNGFVVAGLGSFSSGKITTGSKTGLGEVNAFYRNFALDVDEKGSPYNPKIKPTRLRLSIAGYVEEENPINYKGEIYNNWLGFIDSKNTTIPSGTFTMPSSISTSIIDKRGNRGEAMEQTVVVNDFLNRYDKEKTLYGTWDIESPVVSSYMKENLTTIEFEEVIPVDFSQSLSAQGLEIHFLDNSSYNQFEGYSNWKWRTKIGWLYKNESTEITLPLDNKGGSRMTFAENKTGGGLRLSSIVDSIEALSCKNLDLEKTITFTTDFSQSTTYEAFFGKSEDLAFDVPYLSLRFSELSKEFSLNNNYELLYSRHDSQGNPIGFITDLAGNLLYDFTVNSPDKNPPKIFLSIGAVHKDKLYIMFSKKLDWKDSNGNADEGKLRRIVKSLSIFDSKGNDTGLIDYKKGSRTKIVTETEKSTGIEISLTRSISYEELKNLYIGVNVFDSRDELIAGDGDKAKEDSISGEHGNFSMLYDLYENPASKDLKHCLSDFAVNALDVLYAYDGRVADEAILAQGVYGGNQWTVTNFTENKDNSSQIISDKDISIVSKIKDPASLEKQDKFSMIADISPNLQSTGSDFEIYTTINPRLWFTDYIKFFSTDPNNSENIEKDNISSISGKIENIVSGDKNQNITFVLPNHPKNENSLGWGAGNEIQFLFKVFDKDGNPLMVDGNQDGDFEDDVDHPLFAVRLKDENDLTSIDLWSLNIVDILRQKGGVTILNNVINPLNSEECAIEITIPKAGNLTVQVLTLDGNVVKVIQRGRVEEGTYYYKWNGKNISGDSVARGMYFIRVVGPNIEETRKVMVVW